MLRPTILLFIAFSLLFQSAPAHQELQPMPYEDAEAYRVYSAILQTEEASELTQKKGVVIRSETDGYKMCLKPEQESVAMMSSAIAEYVRLNEKPHRLLRAFDNNIQHDLITADDLKSIFEQGDKGDVMGGWNNFYKTYPNSGGYTTLSAVGFNEDKSVAVVYQGHHCGGLCGEGRFHVLQKKDGKWRPLEWKGNWCSWIS